MFSSLYFLSATYLTEPGLIPKGAPLTPEQIRSISETPCKIHAFLTTSTTFAPPSVHLHQRWQLLASRGWFVGFSLISRNFSTTLPPSSCLPCSLIRRSANQTTKVAPRCISPRSAGITWPVTGSCTTARACVRTCIH